MRWPEELQAQVVATYTNFLHSDTYVTSFHPPSSIAKHVKLAFWWVLCGRPTFLNTTALVFQWCMG